MNNMIDLNQNLNNENLLSWNDWNKFYIEFLNSMTEDFEERNISKRNMIALLDKLPQEYSIINKIKKLEKSNRKKLNIKSFLAMIRFFPALEQYHDYIYFFLTPSNRFGVNISKSTKELTKRLDIVFKEDDELIFYYSDSDEGFIRISGESFLTNYLSNSYKIETIFNMIE